MYTLHCMPLLKATNFTLKVIYGFLIHFVTSVEKQKENQENSELIYIYLHSM